MSVFLENLCYAYKKHRNIITQKKKKKHRIYANNHKIYCSKHVSKIIALLCLTRDVNLFFEVQLIIESSPS